MKTLHLTLATTALVLSATLVAQAQVHLREIMGFGTNWTMGSKWSDGQPASPANDYLLDAGLLEVPNEWASMRTPSVTNATPIAFPGNSLTLRNGGRINLKAASSNDSPIHAVFNFSDLRVPQLDALTHVPFIEHGGDGNNDNFTVGGAISVLGRLELETVQGTRSLTVQSLISGNGTVTATRRAGNPFQPFRTVVISNPQNTFTGTYASTRGAILAFDYNVTGANLDFPIFWEPWANPYPMWGRLHLEGTLTFREARRQIQDGSWVTLAPGSYTFPELQAAGFSQITRGDGTTHQFFVDAGGTLVVTGAVATDPIHPAHLSIVRNGNEIELVLNTTAGERYRMEVSSDLQTWDALGEVIDGTGGAFTLPVMTEGLNRRFFRAFTTEQP